MNAERYGDNPMNEIFYKIMNSLKERGYVINQIGKPMLDGIFYRVSNYKYKLNKIKPLSQQFVYYNLINNINTRETSYLL